MNHATLSVYLLNRFCCCSIAYIVVLLNTLLFYWFDCYSIAYIVVLLITLLFYWIHCYSIAYIVVLLITLLFYWIHCCSIDYIVVLLITLLFYWLHCCCIDSIAVRSDNEKCKNAINAMVRSKTLPWRCIANTHRATGETLEPVFAWSCCSLVSSRCCCCARCSVLPKIIRGSLRCYWGYTHPYTRTPYRYVAARTRDICWVLYLGFYAGYSRASISCTASHTRKHDRYVTAGEAIPIRERLVLWGDSHGIIQEMAAVRVGDRQLRLAAPWAEARQYVPLLCNATMPLLV